MVIGGSSWRVRSTYTSEASHRGLIQAPKDSRGNAVWEGRKKRRLQGERRGNWSRREFTAILKGTIHRL